MKIFIFVLSLFLLAVSVHGRQVRGGSCSLGLENIAHAEIRAIGEKTMHCIHGELHDASLVKETIKNTAGCDVERFIPPPGPPEPPRPPHADSASTFENIFE